MDVFLEIFLMLNLCVFLLFVVLGGFCRKHQLSLSWVSVVFEVDETMLFSGRF